MMWYDDGTEGQTMRELLDRFEKENPGITVVMDTVAYKDIHNILQGQVETGTGPDMARVTDVRRFAGKYLDMRPTMADAAAWEANWPEQVLDSMRSDANPTGLHGFPTQFTVTGPFINRTLFEQAGVPVPSDTSDKVTWDEWVTAAKKVAEATETPTPLPSTAPAIASGAPPLHGRHLRQSRRLLHRRFARLPRRG